MGSTVLAISHNGGDRFMVVDADNWSRIPALTLPGNGYKVARSFDHKYLAISHDLGNRLTVAKTMNWAVVSGVPQPNSYPRGPSYSIDGAYLAYGTDGAGSGERFFVLDTSNWDTVSTPSFSTTVNCTQFSPDGVHILLGNATATASERLYIYTLSNWERVSGTPSIAGGIQDFSFSPNGQYVAIAHFGSSPFFVVLNTSDWSIVSGTPSLPSGGTSCDFSPNGEYLALTHAGGKFFTVLNTNNWSVVDDTPQLPAQGNYVAFSPDGTYLAIAHSGSNPGKGFTVVRTSDWEVVANTPVLADWAGASGLAWIDIEFLLPTPTSLQSVATGGNRALVSWDWVPE